LFVAVVAATGFAPASAVTAIANAASHSPLLHFGSSVRVMPAREDPLSLSCPAAGDCVGLDEEGNAFVETAGAWAPPSRLRGERIGDAVSCGSTTSCIAVGSPYDFEWNGHRWSRIAHTAASGGISCVTATRCLAVAEFANEGAWWLGHHWSKRFEITRDVDLEPSIVACPTARRCLVGYGNGSVTDWNGHAWSKPQHVLADLYDLACGGPRSCLATSSNDHSRRWNGRAWGATKTISDDGFVQVQALACPTVAECVGVGNGGLMTYQARHWTGPTSVGTAASVTAIDCVSVGDCTAVALGGTLLTGTATELSTAGTVDRETVATSMSCASTTACVIVDSTGHARSWNGSKWAPRSSVDGVGLNAVSCPTARYCAAVDNAGRVVTDRDGSWSKPSLVDSHYVQAGQSDELSCSGPGYCALVSGGFTVNERAGVWGNPLNLDPAPFLSVSCPVRDFCAATDFYGRAYTYDGTTWSTGDEIDPGAQNAYGLSHVSCSGPTNCVAEGSGTRTTVHSIAITSELLRYGGAKWKRIPGAHYLSDSGGGLSCPTVSRCLTTDGDIIDRDGHVHTVEIPKGHRTAGVYGGIAQVTCPTPSFCAALDTDSGVSFGRS
jgi:hypothetical protein